jgi:hypothetical protein
VKYLEEHFEELGIDQQLVDEIIRDHFYKQVTPIKEKVERTKRFSPADEERIRRIARDLRMKLDLKVGKGINRQASPATRIRRHPCYCCHEAFPRDQLGYSRIWAGYSGRPKTGMVLMCADCSSHVDEYWRKQADMQKIIAVVGLVITAALLPFGLCRTRLLASHAGGVEGTRILS